MSGFYIYDTHKSVVDNNHCHTFYICLCLSDYHSNTFFSLWLCILTYVIDAILTLSRDHVCDYLQALVKEI